MDELLPTSPESEIREISFFCRNESCPAQDEEVIVKARVEAGVLVDDSLPCLTCGEELTPSV